MKKLISILVPFFLFLFLFAGCSDDDTTPADGDESRIYHQKYDFEDLCFEDILLVYDLNDNNTNDFWIELEWRIDSAEYDYNVSTTFKKMFYDNLGSYSKYNDFTYDSWALGDTVVISHSHDWISGRSGITSYGTNSAESFYIHLDRLRHSEDYWAFYLTSRGVRHYGWMRVRCFLVEEFAINLRPEEPIVVGQRE